MSIPRTPAFPCPPLQTTPLCLLILSPVSIGVSFSSSAHQSSWLDCLLKKSQWVEPQDQMEEENYSSYSLPRVCPPILFLSKEIKDCQVENWWTVNELGHWARIPLVLTMLSFLQRRASILWKDRISGSAVIIALGQWWRTYGMGATWHLPGGTHEVARFSAWWLAYLRPFRVNITT